MHLVNYQILDILIYEHDEILTRFLLFIYMLFGFVKYNRYIRS